MTRILFCDAVSLVAMGLAGSGLRATIWGITALPFLLSACGGLLFGVIGFYRVALRQVTVMLERDPTSLICLGTRRSDCAS